MRWRLIAVLVGLTVMVLVVHDIPLSHHLRQVERDRITTALERDAFIFAGRAEETLEDGGSSDTPALEALLGEYRRTTGGRVIITDAGGITIATSDEEATAGRDYSTRPEIQAALAGSPTTGERESTTLGTRLLFVAVPVLSGTKVEGAVRITYPASVIGERVEDRVQGLLMVAGISIAVALAAAFVMAATVTRPLRRLRTATENIASGDLSVRADTDEGPPEVRGLARSFNAMGERLERTMERQRAFASDASHQLRTPLTALRLRLERAGELIDSDPDAARVPLESATQETERLQHLVEGLLALARSEGQQPPVIAVDLIDVVSGRVAMWQALAEEQGVTIELATDGPVAVEAIDGALEQILDNLIDNALSVSPRGSTLALGVSVHGTQAELAVSDRGPGMTPEEIARAFDRFWRSAGAASGGSGLGLAIVRRLVESCGGDVELAPRQGGGLTATVTLRVSTASSPSNALSRRR